MSFPELDRLSELFDLTDKELDRRKVIRGAKESFDHSTRCEKCLWWFPNEDFQTHHKECRWTCGLCGKKYNGYQAFIDHTMYCARTTTMDEPRPRTPATPRRGTSSTGPH